jgi:competence protein ComFB
MTFTEKYDFEFLKNESEKLVIEELERQVEASKDETLCRCNTCIVDMAAMALNMVKPLYRVSLLGTQYVSAAMEEKVYADSLKKGVAKAIDKVRKNPAHD